MSFNNKLLKQISFFFDDITLPPRFPWLLQDRLQFGYRPADARFSLSPADRSVSGLNEFPFLFITRWCPAAPVNTFLQQAIHRYTLAAETPVMNFNLLSAEGAAPRVGLIKGNTPSRGRGHTDRLSPSYPRNYPLIAPVPQAGAYECGEHLPDTPCHCCAPVPSHPLGLRHEFMCFKQL